MSIAPLPNPKKLSYSGLKWQVRELARRMNLLTQMEAKTIESTGAPKFVFSEELARLDVPSVADVVTSLTDLKTAYDESITSSESTNAALTALNAALSAQIEKAATVGGGGTTLSENVYTSGNLRGSISVSVTCNRVEEHSTQSGKYTRHHFSCVWSAEANADYPGPVSGASSIRVVWLNGSGDEVNSGSTRFGAMAGATGTAPWYIPATGSDSGSCAFYYDISPFSSNVTPTIYNAVRFEVQANDVYSPKSGFDPILYRTLGNGSTTNGTTIEPT